MKANFFKDKSLIFLFQLPQIEEHLANDVEHRINKQISDVNNQIQENSAQNQSNLEETDHAFVKRKPKTMRSTSLYVSVFLQFHAFYKEYHFD